MLEGLCAVLSHRDPVEDVVLLQRPAASAARRQDCPPPAGCFDFSCRFLASKVKSNVAPLRDPIAIPGRTLCNKIVTLSHWHRPRHIVFCGGRAKNSEVEGRAVADCPLGPHLATVAFHDLPHAGETDAGARELARLMQPLEWPEQLVHVGEVEAGPIVADIAADAGRSPAWYRTRSTHRGGRTRSSSSCCWRRWVTSRTAAMMRAPRWRQWLTGRSSGHQDPRTPSHPEPRPEARFRHRTVSYCSHLVV